jgi:hypothetical protein
MYWELLCAKCELYLYDLYLHTFAVRINRTTSLLLTLLLFKSSNKEVRCWHTRPIITTIKRSNKNFSCVN